MQNKEASTREAGKEGETGTKSPFWESIQRSLDSEREHAPHFALQH